jgi:hypothetical protein
MPIQRQHRQLPLVSWLALYGVVATGVALTIATAVTVLGPGRGASSFLLSAGITALVEIAAGAWLIRRSSR